MKYDARVGVKMTLWPCQCSFRKWARWWRPAPKLCPTAAGADRDTAEVKGRIWNAIRRRLRGEQFRTRANATPKEGAG